MPPSSVTTYLSGSALRILVAASGGDATERNLAAQSLIATLRTDSNVKLVVDSSALGDLSTLDDAAIVAKAKAQPVDQVFIVRVFPGSGSNWSAVVTMYTLDGTSIGGFSGGTDFPLASATAYPSAGMSNAAAAAVASVTGNAGHTSEEALKEFQEKAVWFQEWAAVNQYGSVVSTWSVPMGGRYGEPLTGKKFYAWINEDALVEQYKKKANVKYAIMGASLVPITVGTVWLTGIKDTLYTHPSCGERNVRDPVYMECMEVLNDEIKSNNTRVEVIGSTVGGIGLITFLIAGSIDPNPLPPNERVRAADEYNEKLRNSLGLPSPTASNMPVQVPVQAVVSGWVTGDGGGVTLGFTW